MTDQELLSLCNEKLLCDPNKGVLLWRDTNRKAGCYDGNYIVISVNNRHTSIHRILFLMCKGYLPDYIDHINGNKIDNRLINLRECTKQQNHFNIGLTSVNKSGYKGVGWRPNKNKWRARIMINQKEKSLGHFDCKHEAAEAYNKAAKKLFGEFAWLNPIPSDKNCSC